MGASRDIALSELPIRGVSIQTAADGDGSITVVPSDSGVIFVNKYITGNTTYTLPAVALCAGKWFWFYNAQTTKTLIVDGDDTKMMGGGQTAYDSMTGTADTGACGFILGDGTNYFFFEIARSWTAGT